MPVRGPAPKPQGQARRRNQPTYEWVDVVDEPFVDAPKLPARLPNEGPWPTWVRRWWRIVSAMPHCKLWTAADWEFAYDTAAMKAQFYATGSPSAASEIRNRERVMGTTADFRRALRIRYVPAPPSNPAPPAVAKLDDYRDL